MLARADTIYRVWIATIHKRSLQCFRPKLYGGKNSAQQCVRVQRRKKRTKRGQRKCRANENIDLFVYRQRLRGPIEKKPKQRRHILILFQHNHELDPLEISVQCNCPLCPLDKLILKTGAIGWRPVWIVERKNLLTFSPTPWLAHSSLLTNTRVNSSFLFSGRCFPRYATPPFATQSMAIQATRYPLCPPFARALHMGHRPIEFGICTLRMECWPLTCTRAHISVQNNKLHALHGPHFEWIDRSQWRYFHAILPLACSVSFGRAVHACLSVALVRAACASLTHQVHTNQINSTND